MLPWTRFVLVLPRLSTGTFAAVGYLDGSGVLLRHRASLQKPTKSQSSLIQQTKEKGQKRLPGPGYQATTPRSRAAPLESTYRRRFIGASELMTHQTHARKSSSLYLSR
ncbi:hypothetical protein MAPG_00289 [Magnaporthiopsis poae ATCC 64411]|uniref:Secreted protein n=1 Tax=Magnaporthiopsis poae (strain ATCC 64411 / 73-15) TaxID=644358 RepID=A0A0C4DKL3_MAGP6|nr:hypothetical protein MAPG_00289 [Magnaporthiopsis poae ATCC 64411]